MVQGATPETDFSMKREAVPKRTTLVPFTLKELPSGEILFLLEAAEAPSGKEAERMKAMRRRMREKRFMGNGFCFGMIGTL